MDIVSKQRLGEGVHGESRFHHVYADSRERFTTSFGSKRPICYGDRLFARIVMRGRTIMEFVLNQVSDMTELLGELRKKVTGIRGLAQVYVRNYSRGWSMQQPLMLYTTTTSSGLNVGNRQSVSSFWDDAELQTDKSPQPERKMLFPWETH